MKQQNKKPQYRGFLFLMKIKKRITNVILFFEIK